MFGLFKKREPELTNESYFRWLRAQRPPWLFFLGLSDLEQEALAKLGDEHAADICCAIGAAVADPGLADAGLDAVTNPEAEEYLAKRLAVNFLRSALGGQEPQNAPQAQPLRAAEGMGGALRRRAELKLEREQASRKSMSFMGEPPDEPGVSA